MKTVKQNCSGKACSKGSPKSRTRESIEKGLISMNKNPNTIEKELRALNDAYSSLAALGFIISNTILRADLVIKFLRGRGLPI